MKKRITKFRPIILSRHPSHSILRSKNKTLPLFNFRSIVRFGSTTETEKYNFSNRPNIAVELNTPNAIKNSSNKLLMKQCFTNNNVRTAMWWTYVNRNNFNNSVFLLAGDPNNSITPKELPYPLIAKSHFGSRGMGNHKIDSIDELEAFVNSHNTSHYIFEKFYNFSREYRLHVTKNGYFYTCRKMLKSDTPDNKKWFRNDSNSVWVREDSDSNLFDKPVNWTEIEKECVKALNSVGLDFGAVDLKVQSSKTSKEYPDYIIIEINSAPSFGDITIEKYKEIIPKLLLEKYNER